MRAIRRVCAVSILATAALMLTACGGSERSAPAPAAPESATPPAAAAPTAASQASEPDAAAEPDASPDESLPQGEEGAAPSPQATPEK